MKLSYCLLILTVSADLTIGLTLENVASNGTLASESFNTSLHPVPQALASSPAHHDIIAKEGTSILIECKVNISQYEYILWYNSKGHLLQQKDEGEFFCCFISLGILLLCSTWKSLELYCFLFLSSHFYGWKIGENMTKLWHVLDQALYPSSEVIAHSSWYSALLSFSSRNITACSTEELSIHPTRL